MNPKAIVRKIVPSSLTRGVEQTYRYSRGFAVSARLGFPGTNAKVIGITGTNGKTTTCTFINNILKEAGYKTAVKTTVFTEVKGKYVKNQTDLTSGVTSEMLGFVKQYEKEVDYVIIEVTSQVLDQYRLWGVNYVAAGITNLTYEHMEYHHSFDEYARAKAKLFQSKPKLAVFNADDDWYKFFKEYPGTEKTLSYGKSRSANFRIVSMQHSLRGSKVEVEADGHKIAFNTSVIGEFNVYNATLAAAIAWGLGVDKRAIAKGIKALDWIDGRMNYVDGGQAFPIFCDYAHTPDGLEQVLRTLKPLTKGKIILVQSSMDGRDPEKRPKLGEVAAQWADSIYVTDEEAFRTPPEVMRRDIIRGIKAEGGENKYREIPDRQKAIDAAIKEAKKDDTVLIVPFGHITHRTFFDKTEPWDDREAAKRAVKKLKRKKK